MGIASCVLSYTRKETVFNPDLSATPANLLSLEGDNNLKTALQRMKIISKHNSNLEKNTYMKAFFPSISLLLFLFMFIV